MLMDEYFSAMKNVLTKAENTQREAILAAADEIANRLEKGGAWHIMDTGHMLMFEAVGRTGGMMAIKPIKITCEIQNPVRYRPSPARGIIGYDSIPGFADYVLGRANVLPEDVIMIGSVSGYNYFPVDLAIKANEMGCATIALTSVEYSSHLTSKHFLRLVPTVLITARTMVIRWSMCLRWDRVSARQAVSAPAI